MSDARPRFRILRAPELNTDLLIIRRAPGDAEWTLIGRQLQGVGRVIPAHEPWVPDLCRCIEIYSSATDLGRARLKRLDAPLRDFLGLAGREHPHLDVDDVDEIPLDIDGYV